MVSLLPTGASLDQVVTAYNALVTQIGAVDADTPTPDPTPDPTPTPDPDDPGSGGTSSPPVLNLGVPSDSPYWDPALWSITENTGSELQGLKGRNDPPWFTVTADGQRIRFHINAGAGTTQNSQNPRSELREYGFPTAGQKASWSMTSGSHLLVVRTSIAAMTCTVEPISVLGQIHNDSDDIFELYGDFSDSALKSGYDFGVGVRLDGKTIGWLSHGVKKSTDFDFAIYAPGDGSGIFFFKTDQTRDFIASDAVLKVSAATIAATGLALSGCYFKTGNYLQDNTSKGEDPNNYADVDWTGARTKHSTSAGSTAAVPTGMLPYILSSNSPTPTPTPTPDPTPTPGTGFPTPTGIVGHWAAPKLNATFEGSSLDTSIFSPGWYGDSGYTGPVDTKNEGAVYSDTMVSVSGGYLNLASKAQKASSSVATKSYITGLVTTQDNYEFTYGAFEARMYLPAASDGSIANWPALWADCASGNWPTDGEIDVMEGLSGSAAWHFHYGSPPNGSQVGADVGDPDDYAGGWHIFGAYWTPSRIDFYYDGKKVGSATTGITSKPMFLILGNALPETGLTAGATVKVDYLRHWAQATSGTDNSSPAGTTNDGNGGSGSNTDPTPSPTPSPSPSPSNATYPAQVLDLSRWKLTIPSAASGSSTAATIQQPALAKYKDSNFAVSGNGVLLKAPAQGATTSSASGATRCEFREMSSSGSEASWSWKDGKTHTLTTSFASADWSHMTVRKEGIVGQVHGASGTPPLYLSVNQDDSSAPLILWINGHSVANLLTGCTPGKAFSYKINVHDQVCDVYAAFGDATKLTKISYSTAVSKFTTDTSGLYFKAGCYNKEPISAKGTGYAQTLMTGLKVV